MRFWLSSLFFIFIIEGYSQTLVPLERIRDLNTENYLPLDAKSPHTDIKPLIEEDYTPYVRIDSALTTGCYQNGRSRSWFVRKVYFEHFLKADTGDFHIAADPLCDFQGGYDIAGKRSVYRNTRGLQILGNIAGKLSFYTCYYETQARFPEYINKFVRHYQVVPGMCIAKPYKGDAWDYGVATGSASYSPYKYINIQIGYGKNFFGNGYRSLLLSDNSFQYPFLKLTGSYRRFEYVSMFTSFTNLKTDSVLDMPYIYYAGYQKKPGSFNYLSVNATKWLELGLFEGIVWKSHGLKDHQFNINQFMPVILVNTIRYSLSGKNNSVIGLNVNIRPLKKIQFYGQFVLDDMNFKKSLGSGSINNKYGFQAGTKWLNTFGLKNLIIQAEYNQVRPYTYSHEDALQSYTNYNQPLAHPLGSNFRELVGFIDYRYRRLYTEIQINYAKYGADTNNSDWGSDIFYSDKRAELGDNSVGNKLGQGLSTKLLYASVRIGCMFNPRYHLCVEGGLSIRDLSNTMTNQKSTTIWIGLRTNLFNQYFDF